MTDPVENRDDWTGDDYEYELARVERERDELRAALEAVRDHGASLDSDILSVQSIARTALSPEGENFIARLERDQGVTFAKRGDEVDRETGRRVGPEEDR